MTILTQTKDTKTIHPGQFREMIIPRNKLQAQRELRNQSIQEHAQQRRTLVRNKKGGERFAMCEEKADVMQLIARHPEMPEERELDIEDRKKLAEIMLENPPRQGSQEQTTQEMDHRRKYTCLNCDETFITPIG